MNTIENAETTTLNHQKVEAFAGQVVSDLSAGISGVMIQLGHELGLYKAMVDQGRITARTLADRTNTFERYVQEWLNNQAAGGYVDYYPEDQTFELSQEHAIILAVEDSPAFMVPGFNLVSCMWYDKDKIADIFRTGQGMGWHQHHHDLFYGTEAFFRSGYKANLVDVWIPALENMDEKLKIGGRVADIGCGHGASTLIMAEKYPNSEFYGFDYHQESIEVARQRAEEAGITNAFFITAAADEYAEGNFDLICFMDAFHDFGNPLQAIVHAQQKLAEDGSLMLVEPAAGDNLEDNFNPIGRLFYAGSTALCVPNSHSQEGDFCLGAQAGPARVESIAKDAGYHNFKIASQNPFNMIFEIKVS